MIDKRKCNCPRKPGICKDEGFAFRKVVIPASLGDDVTGKDKPVNGAYKNSYVVYEANGAQYLYDSGGIFTKMEDGGKGTLDFNELENRPKYNGVEMTGDTDIPDASALITEEVNARIEGDNELRGMINGKQDALTPAQMDAVDSGIDSTKVAQIATNTGNIADEILAREGADNDLQGQIDALSAASDVTDIVGTYAALQAYDTSKLKDNDIIKVLQDETHDDETTYYRWSTSTETFSLIGEEGPYYTKAAADQKFQDKLTAGAHISIDANNEISADYTHFTGATSLADGTAGLVPAPVAGDEDKALKGDGTWGNVSSQTIFYANLNETGNTRHIYKDINFTTAASAQDIIDANDEGQVILRGTSTVNPTAYSDSYLQNAFIMPHNNDYEFVFLDRDLRYEYTVSDPVDTAFYYDTSEIQPKLTAGSNVNITGTTISATDTTYSNFTGTDGVDAGTAGLVPAPATTDAGKYLKSDGTWDTVAAGPTVVQTTGTSTTSVMSQVATSQLIYPNGYETNKSRIRIGYAASAGAADALAVGNRSQAGAYGAAYGDYATATRGVAVGYGTYNSASGGIAIGYSNGGITAGIGKVKNTGENGGAIGAEASNAYENSFAIGYKAITSRTNEISFGKDASGADPESTHYIAHVTDPSLATDAANKRYVDTAVASAGATVLTPVEYTNLWENA